MLPGLLTSLAGQDLDFDLVVVDNASTDGSLDLVRDAYPAARVIQVDHNSGFAVAAERGIRECSSPYVALLNYDLELGPGYLSTCLAALEAEATLGSVQGVLLRPGGAVVDSAGHVASRGRWFRNRGEEQRRDAQAWAPARTFGVTAAAAVYRRAMLEEVAAVTGHVLDPNFFAYLEDVDLDWRARGLGWESAVVAGATAEHRHSGSGARRSTRVQRHIIKNRLLVLYRNQDMATLIPDLPWVVGQVLARWVKALLTSPASLAGITDAVRLLRAERPQRHAILAARKVPARDLRAWFLGRMP